MTRKFKYICKICIKNYLIRTNQKTNVKMSFGHDARAKIAQMYYYNKVKTYNQSYCHLDRWRSLGIKRLILTTEPQQLIRKDEQKV